MTNPRPPWWLKPMNKVLIAATRIGLLKEGPMVLTVTGRKSGRPRSTPITPFEVDGRRHVVGGSRAPIGCATRKPIPTPY